MPALISLDNKYDFLLMYASAPVQRILINASKCSYSQITRNTFRNIVLGLYGEFLTNEKFDVVVNDPAMIKDIIDSLRIPDNPFRLMQYGQVINKPFQAIVFDGSLNHINDLMNASFMVMDKDPSLANAMIQAVFLLQRVYKDDIPIDVAQQPIGGLKPYEI